MQNNPRRLPPAPRPGESIPVRLAFNDLADYLAYHGLESAGWTRHPNGTYELLVRRIPKEKISPTP